ncbi:MAG: tRNA glutamyl-Q synthetase [Opitutae bacterium]|nr:tRNA glutamyl-Q synthetase [Opitutae bacterium]MBT6959007.1 tRNA glutamyl-Q synthetase [Opitutae bacterium]MBT7855008.1 tRNA glutamyl-Q synthetase [Opitutae bacterium]
MNFKKDVSSEEISYRGRIAPTPSGLLHAGHARTFWVAWHRSRVFNGLLIFRTEDLDPLRCKANLVDAALRDLRWLGLSWEEGPDIGGSFGPYTQSERTITYENAWQKLLADGYIYPCTRSRKELRLYTKSQGVNSEDPLYPLEWRPDDKVFHSDAPGGEVAWRFRVPEHRKITFVDGCLGERSFETYLDFGDFLIWRRDGIPAYELAVVVDDIAMKVTEVVRGEDLLVSTARQILLYEALGQVPPFFFHCPLLLDMDGQKLSKSFGSRSIQDHRENSVDPCEWSVAFTDFYQSL